MSESNQPKGSVYDMPDDDYERLESAAQTAWRMSYPKFAVDADGEEERGECFDAGVSFTDARDCYTDGYRTGYLIAAEAASSTPEPAAGSHPAEVAAPPGEQWERGAKATITGIHLRVGEAVTLIEASSVIPGCWYVYLRNGGIALYPKQDLKPLPAPPKGTP